MTAADKYVLYDGSSWWFYLGRVNGEPESESGVPLEQGQEHGWWRAGPEHGLDGNGPGTIYVASPPRKRLAYYSRSIEVPGYPPTLDVDAYENGTDEDDMAYDRRVAVIYDAVYEEKPGEREPIPGPWLILEGAPASAEADWDWHANLPHALRYAEEYRHLFPGRLIGFRAALKTELSALGVGAFDQGGQFTVYVNVEVPPLEPVKWQKPPGRRRGTPKERERHTVTRTLVVPVSDYVEGKNLQAAEACWAERMDEISSYVKSILAHPCPTCHGRGWVEPKGRK